MTLDEILNKYMIVQKIGAQKLATMANDAIGVSNFLHRSTIRNWRDGSSKKSKNIRNWRQVIVVAFVLDFAKDDVSSILRVAGLPTLEQILQQLKLEKTEELAKYQKFVERWVPKNEQNALNRGANALSVFDQVDMYYQLWRAADYSLRGEAFISYDTFLLINKHFAQFESVSAGKKAFLLRSAVQNGMGGQWGRWLIPNKHNLAIVEPLVRALDTVMGIQPAWRSACILEATFGNGISAIWESFDADIKERIQLGSGQTVADWNQHIGDTGMQHYLKVMALDRSTLDDKRRKIIKVLDEMQVFSKYLVEYAKEQTIGKQWRRLYETK